MAVHSLCRFILCFMLVVVLVHSALNDKDWDILYFTQQWPISTCLDWKLANPSNVCRQLKNNSEWTIHGIWPRKFGTKGPNNCNSSWVFNLTEVKSLQSQLKELWPSVLTKGSLDDFWRHEWNKHGTCVAQLPALNTEMKYFGQGLKWNKKYNLLDILNRSGIQPTNNTGYYIQEISKALKNSVTTEPIFTCIFDKTHKAYISEIKICFDKKLNLTDCGNKNNTEIKNGNNNMGNCPQKTVVYYLVGKPPGPTPGPAPGPTPGPTPGPNPGPKPTRFWVILISVLLLLVIVPLLIYLVYRFWKPFWKKYNYNTLNTDGSDSIAEQKPLLT